MVAILSPLPMTSAPDTRSSGTRYSVFRNQILGLQVPDTGTSGNRYSVFRHQILHGSLGTRYWVFMTPRAEQRILTHSFLIIIHTIKSAYCTIRESLVRWWSENQNSCQSHSQTILLLPLCTVPSAWLLGGSKKSRCTCAQCPIRFRTRPQAVSADP